MAFPTWSYKGQNFIGSSIAGTFTSIFWKELKIVFDVGNGPHSISKARHFLLTHGHADHASGLPYLLSMKSLLRHPKANVYLPADLSPKMEKVLRLWEEIEDHQYNFELFPCSMESHFEISSAYSVRPFPTFHRVPSNGYTVFRRNKKLKEEFKNISREEILAAKESGVEVEDIQEVPFVSFTGDTKIEFLDHCPWIKDTEILFLEVSFIDEARTIEETREWGHIHLDEVIPRLPELNCEKIVFIHLSARYSTKDFENLLRDRVSPELMDRIVVFPRN